MNIWKISIQNLKSKPLYTFLSVFMLALSITLLLGVQQLKSSFQYQMENNLGNIDLIIGAKGSPLQLVLASVLHLDNPTGNISYAEAKKIGKSPMIKSAVPISYGDNYKGFRIIGTTPKFLSLYNAELETGRKVEKSMEVVLGNSVAKKANLSVGDTFKSSHGLVVNDLHIHDEKLTVVGILKPTQKVIDRLIVSNLESIWDTHHHVEEHEHYHCGKHQQNKEITSLLIRFRNPAALLTLPRRINKETNMQVALPKYELDRLYQFTGIGFNSISFVAYLILIISGVMIFISLYKMIKERAFDLALLRTYGASNFQLIKMVGYESVIIVVMAFTLGVLIIKTGLNFMLTFTGSNHIQNILQPLQFSDILQTGLWVLVMVILAVLFAIYPIIKMNISRILNNEK